MLPADTDAEVIAFVAKYRRLAPFSRDSDTIDRDTITASQAKAKRKDWRDILLGLWRLTEQERFVFWLHRVSQENDERQAKWAGVFTTNPDNTFTQEQPIPACPPPDYEQHLTMRKSLYPAYQARAKEKGWGQSYEAFMQAKKRLDL